MSSIITMLKKVEENPLIFLCEKNLRYLHSFIDGYLLCEKDNGSENSMVIFEDFIRFFNELYGVRSYYDYSSILREEYNSEEEAFDKFFELFNKFLLQRCNDK